MDRWIDGQETAVGRTNERWKRTKASKLLLKLLSDASETFGRKKGFQAPRVDVHGVMTTRLSSIVSDTRDLRGCVAEAAMSSVRDEFGAAGSRTSRRLLAGWRHLRRLVHHLVCSRSYRSVRSCPLSLFEGENRRRGSWSWILRAVSVGRPSWKRRQSLPVRYSWRII